MKALKLIGVFVVVVAALFLALNWNSLFKAGKKSDFAEKDLIDVAEKCDEIRDAWKAIDGWDETLFRQQREDIDQDKKMSLFTEDSYNTVNNTLRETATNKVVEGYLDALHNQKFNAATLQKWYAGVAYLIKNENLGGNERIKQVVVRQQLYSKIKAFVGSSHKMTPKFDTDRADWTSLASLQRQVLNTASSYRNNPLFKEMSHIPGFKDGLDNNKLSRITGNQRPAFYKDLSQQIIRYFKSEEPTPDKVRLLNQIYNNFASQETDYGLYELAELKVKYGKD